MKKFCIFLLLTFPVIAPAQKISGTKNEPVKKSTKYSDFISKPGVCTIVTYQIPEVIMTSAYGDGKYTDKITFSLNKFTINSMEQIFLSMYHSNYNGTASATVAASEIKVLYEAITEMIQKKQTPKPEGAASIKYTFISDDGIYIEYFNNSWRICLERHSKDEIWVSNIEPFYNRLNDILQKLETIK